MATEDFREWCRDQGGELVEQGEKVACEIDGETINQPRTATDMDGSTGFQTTSRLSRWLDMLRPGLGVSMLTVVLVLTGLAITSLTKAWAISTVLAEKSGLASNVLLATYLPVISVAFVKQLPLWAWYAVVWSWLGIAIAIAVFVAAFGRLTRIPALLGGLGFLIYAIANGLGSALSAAAITLIETSGGWSTPAFAQIYLMTRFSIGAIPMVVLSPKGIFELSAFTWLAVVVYWLIQMFSVAD